MSQSPLTSMECSPLSSTRLVAQLPRRASHHSQPIEAAAQSSAFELEQRLAGLTCAPPVKLPYLPPELHLDILHFAAASFSHAETAQRRAFLAQASLVCSSWKGDAQKLLWEKVLITSDAGAESYLGSPDKTHGTRSLEIVGVDDWIEGKLAVRLLLVCDKFESLHLKYIDEISPKDLWVPSLANLKSLKMHRTVRWRPPANCYGWIQLPFKLEHLHLDLYWTIMHAPSLIVAALISSAHESAVLDLKLPLPNSNGKRAPLLGVNSQFPARYSPVKKLTLLTDPGDVNHEILRYLLPQYPGFYALKDLTISFINISILECLRTPLARLVVTEDINLDSLAFTHKLFGSNVKATASLEHLGVYGHIFVNHKTLLECEVEKREIKLSVGRPATPYAPNPEGKPPSFKVSKWSIDEHTAEDVLEYSADDADALTDYSEEETIFSRLGGLVAMGMFD